MCLRSCTFIILLISSLGFKYLISLDCLFNCLFDILIKTTQQCEICLPLKLGCSVSDDYCVDTLNVDHFDVCTSCNNSQSDVQ